MAGGAPACLAAICQERGWTGY